MARKKQNKLAATTNRAIVIGLVGVWLVVIALWMGDSATTDAAVSAGIFGFFGFVFGIVAFTWLLLGAVKR